MQKALHLRDDIDYASRKEGGVDVSSLRNTLKRRKKKLTPQSNSNNNKQKKQQKLVNRNGEEKQL